MYSFSNDRFIPNRANIDFDYWNYALTNKNIDEKVEEMYRSLNPGKNKRLFTNLNKPQEEVPIIITEKPKIIREIQDKPFKVLDAPDVVDDYYTNILDINDTNICAIALNEAIYSFRIDTGHIDEIKVDVVDDEEIYFSALKFSKLCDKLGTGTTDGKLDIVDLTTKKSIKTINTGAVIINSISWQDNNVITISIGAGHIISYDSRTNGRQIWRNNYHRYRIAGLKWSPCNNFLASSDEGKLCIMDKRNNTQPLIMKNDYKSSVKALDWCPWNQRLLGTGAGLEDKRIRILDTCTSKFTKEVQTDSQITSLHWSEPNKEIITTHRLPIGEINIWDSSDMSIVKKINQLNGVITSAQTKSCDTLVSVNNEEETVKCWKINEITNNRKRKRGNDSTDFGGPLTIR